MKFLVVIQIHPNGQRNVSLSSDPMVKKEDLLVTSGGWENATVFSEEIIILGTPGFVRLISDCELRSVNNATEVMSAPVDNVFDIRCLLEKYDTIS